MFLFLSSETNVHNVTNSVHESKRIYYLNYNTYYYSYSWIRLCILFTFVSYLSHLITIFLPSLMNTPLRVGAALSLRPLRSYQSEFPEAPLAS